MLFSLTAAGVPLKAGYDIIKHIIIASHLLLLLLWKEVN